MEACVRSRFDGRIYRADDGAPVRIAGVVADVTERRRIEEALDQAQKLQTVGTIAGGVAHNFNNLLTIVLGNLDLASREGFASDRLGRCLTAAARAAERGADLTRQLLNSRSVPSRSNSPGSSAICRRCSTARFTRR
jgi:signal transduction histidine kinase